MKKLEKLQAYAREQRIKSLQEKMYALECADDMLFSNASGNRAIYDSFSNELKELLKQQHQFKGD